MVAVSATSQVFNPREQNDDSIMSFFSNICHDTCFQRTLRAFEMYSSHWALSSALSSMLGSTPLEYFGQ